MRVFVVTGEVYVHGCGDGYVRTWLYRVHAFVKGSKPPQYTRCNVVEKAFAVVHMYECFGSKHLVVLVGVVRTQ